MRIQGTYRMCLVACHKVDVSDEDAVLAKTVGVLKLIPENPEEWKPSQNDDEYWDGHLFKKVC